MRATILLALAVALAPAPALAQTVLYQNNFDTENGGQSATGINSFTGFHTPPVTFSPPPTIDLVRTGDFGLTCAGGSGSCIDLDGNTNSPGLLESDAHYAFTPSDRFVLTYSIGGSQRPGFGTDGYHLGYIFDQFTSYAYRFQSSTGRDETGLVTDGSEFTLNKDGVPFDAGFVDITLTLQPLTSGTFFIGIDGYSGAPNDSDGDNVGLLLDNLKLTQQAAPLAVPEPATWGMMIAGFGALGLAMRRRSQGTLRMA